MGFLHVSIIDNSGKRSSSGFFGNVSMINQIKYVYSLPTKGVFGRPSGPSREGPGVGHNIVSDTKQMTKERKKRKKNEWEKGKMCKEKKKGRKRERKMDRNKQEEIKKWCKTRTETEILTC